MHVPDPPESTEPEGLKELKRLRDEAKAAWQETQKQLTLAKKDLDRAKKSVSYDSDEEDESDDEGEDSKDQSHPSMYSQKKRLVEELEQKAKAAEHEFHIREEQVERALQESHKSKEVVTFPSPLPPTPPLLSRAEQPRVIPLTSMLEYVQPPEPPQPVSRQNKESRTPSTPQPDATPEKKKDNLKELVANERWDITPNNTGWKIKTKVPPPAVIASTSEGDRVRVTCEQSDNQALDAMFKAMVADLQDKGVTKIALKITASSEEARKYLEKLCTDNGVEIIPHLPNQSTPSQLRQNDARQPTANPESRASAQVDREERDTGYRR